MARQTLVEPVVNSQSEKGQSDTARIRASFPASPIYNGEITDAWLKEDFISRVQGPLVNDEGHTFGIFHLNFKDAPDLNDVETGGGGLPASPYVPNPVSPGPESMNAADQGAPPEGFGQSHAAQWGEGVGSDLQPKSSSEAISRQTIGSYIKGSATGA